MGRLRDGIWHLDVFGLFGDGFDCSREIWEILWRRVNLIHVTEHDAAVGMIKHTSVLNDALVPNDAR